MCDGPCQNAAVRCGVGKGCPARYCDQFCANRAWPQHAASHGLVEIVVALLNDYTDDRSTISALRMLERKFTPMNKGWVMGIVFDDCDQWSRERSQTAKANSRRIVICEDIRTPEFQRRKPSFPTPVGHTTIVHYGAVVLHEFGHILDKNGFLERAQLDENWSPHKQEGERQADWWAYQFLSA